MKNTEELKSISNKMDIFETHDSLLHYAETIDDFLKLFYELNDMQKYEIVKKDYFKKQHRILRQLAIASIQSNTIKIEILHDDTIIVGNSAYEKILMLKQILKSMDGASQLSVLKDVKLIKKFEMSEYDLSEMIKSMPKEYIIELLLDTGIINQLNIGKFYIVELITVLDNDDDKKRFMDLYELDKYERIRIYCTLSYESKVEFLKDENAKLSKFDIKTVISSFNIDELIEFVNKNKEFLETKKIGVHELSSIRFIQNMDRANLTEAEKRRAIANLTNLEKSKINQEMISEDYRALLVSTRKYEIGDFCDIMKVGLIATNLDESISIYKDLDDLLYVNPLEMESDEFHRKKLIELCRLCPKIIVRDNLRIGNSTTQEYITGEEWIESVRKKINPDWTDVQKIAYIDTEIGKKISYSPEFGTEAERADDARALWKIIVLGKGVCNGIAQIEQYILKLEGIESELVSSEKHTYVKVKNIEIPTKEGVVKGDTFMDPTWNLAASRYGARPDHSFKDYKGMRAVDIDVEGVDHECHKNDELEKQNTICMDEETLRAVYKRVGLTREDGRFPISSYLERVEEINQTATCISDNIQQKLQLLKQMCPEFAICINSSIKMIQLALFQNNENFNYNKCVASRVYKKDDKEKDAVLYLYFDFKDEGRLFFYADKESGEFVKLSQKEFEDKFECYESDMKKLNGKRPWDTDKQIEEAKELGSGGISEGEEL